MAWRSRWYTLNSLRTWPASIAVLSIFKNAHKKVSPPYFGDVIKKFPAAAVKTFATGERCLLVVARTVI